MSSFSKFLLLVQYWKGQQVIRSGPSRTIYRLLFDSRMPNDNDKLLHFSLLSDPTLSKEFSAVLIPCPDLTALEKGIKGEDKSYLAPREGSFWNDSKDTNTWVEISDSGLASVTTPYPNQFKFIFMGKKLKGIYQAIKDIEDIEDPKKKQSLNLWIFKAMFKPR